MEMLPRKRYVSAMNVLFSCYCVLKVYKCLQPFMVCMSSSVTTSIIDEISDDFDTEVKCWRDKLKNRLEEVRLSVHIRIYYSCLLKLGRPFFC